MEAVRLHYMAGGRLNQLRRNSIKWKEKLRKDLTGWIISGIIFFVLCESRSANMESWLSGRRRTTGNRVGVMSVSRVQIPDSPPEIRTFSNEKVRIFSILEEIQNFFDEIKIFDSNADSNGSRRARCGAGLRLFCPWQTGD